MKGIVMKSYFLGKLSFVVALTLLITTNTFAEQSNEGSTNSSNEVITPESHEDYSASELEALIQGEDRKRNKGGVILRWKDTVDGGDDPMKAGCHMEYNTVQCTDKGVYFGGDSCINSRKLMEYTN